MKALFKVVIPARYNASRLPAKPLLDIAGKTMIQHVYERATASLADDIIIATDDKRIQHAARQFGADVCMTKTSHLSGTDRLAEVAQIREFADDDIVVNVQSDEPCLPPSLINQVANDLNEHGDADISTLYNQLTEKNQLVDSNIVKVVMDRHGNALYFSRAAIPYRRNNTVKTNTLSTACLPYYHHIGLYAYRVRFLKQFTKLDVSPLEQAEQLEQLRALYHGKKIHLSLAVESAGQSVDTEQDLQAVRHLLTGTSKNPSTP